MRKGRQRASKPIANPLRAWWEASNEPINRPDAEVLATRFGCSRSMVYGLLDGTKGPSMTLAARIEKATRGAVPSSAWAKTSMRKARAERRAGGA